MRTRAAMKLNRGVIPSLQFLFAHERLRTVRRTHDEGRQIRIRIRRAPVPIVEHIQIEGRLSGSDSPTGTERKGVASDHEIQRTTSNFSGFSESKIRVWNERQNVSPTLRRVEPHH